MVNSCGLHLVSVTDVYVLKAKWKYKYKVVFNSIIYMAKISESAMNFELLGVFSSNVAAIDSVQSGSLLSSPL